MPKAVPPDQPADSRRSTRPRVISAAAKRSVESEAHLAQQSRRANTGKKKHGSANLKTKKAVKASQNLPPAPIVITAKTGRSSVVPARSQLTDLSNASQARTPAASLHSRPTPSIPSGTRTGQPIPNYRPTSRLRQQPAVARPSILATATTGTIPDVGAASSPQPTETETEEENPAFRELLAVQGARRRIIDPEDVSAAPPASSSLRRRETVGQPLYQDEDEDVEEEQEEEEAMDVDDGEESEAEGSVPAAPKKVAILWDEEDDDVDGDGMSGDGDDEDIASGDEDVVGDASKSKKRLPAKRRKPAPKSGDFDANTCVLLNSALSHARIDTVLKNPYPDVDASIEMAVSCWDAACAQRPALQPVEGVPFVQLTRRAIPQVRGQIKDHARNGGPEAFGIDIRPHRTLFNQGRYAYLIDGNRFIYADVDQMEGPYYNPFGYKVTKTAFFNKATADGVVHQATFGPAMSKQYIALLYTAIRFSLDEWKSGNYKGLKFTAAAYQPIYAEHLANLEALEAADPLFITGLGEELYQDCMASFPAPGTPGSSASMTRTSVNSGVTYAAQRRLQRHQERLAATSAADLAVGAAPF